MADFFEVMLRGHCLAPPIHHIVPVSHEKLLKSLSAARSKRAPAGEVGTTRIFAKAGYFISHTKEAPGASSSQLVVHVAPGSARPRRLGRIALGFSIGDTELLIGGGTSSSKASKEVRRVSAEDLETGNEYRVNGNSYSVADSVVQDRIALERCWKGKGWGAALLVNSAYPNAVIGRTVLHLKPVHAIVVIDELKTKDGTLSVFEQFWHVAPEFRISEVPLQFVSESSGALVAAFDAMDETSITIEIGDDANPIGWTTAKPKVVSPNWYVRREKRLAYGLSVSLFQWGSEIAPVRIGDAQLTGKGWVFDADGRGFDVRFALENDELKRVDKR